VRNLRIDYTALSLTVPDKVHFRYKLEGRDEDWIDAGTRRQAFYTDLAPNDYHFRVVASNNDGVWNHDGVAIGFSIPPAFYQTRSSLFMSTVLLFAAAWALYRMHVRRVAAQLNVRFEERLAERARIAQDLHDTLLQGFISTSMQLDIVAEGVQDDACRSQLERILRRMRQVVEEGRDAVHGLRAAPAGDDLEHALACDAEELRGRQAIETSVVVGGQRQPLHPLIRDEVYRIGREALANAFRHAHATRVEVELEFGAKHFRLKIRDNGRGIESRIAESGRPGHWGIPGMRERAERLDATLTLWTRVKVGTEVDLVVPGSVAFQRVTSSKRRPGGLPAALSRRDRELDPKSLS
jgi:signal transduction histidine kinase